MPSDGSGSKLDERAGAYRRIAAILAKCPTRFVSALADALEAHFALPPRPRPSGPLLRLKPPSDSPA